MRGLIGYLFTGLIAAAAIAAGVFMYFDYVINPWTRDGQVRANVIQVTPRVSGPVVRLPIRDNQAVKAGDLLFEIDPRTFQAQLARAQAEYDRTVKDLVSLSRQVEAAEASIEQYRSAISQAESEVNATEATLKEARLNLKRQRHLLEGGDIAQARFDKIERNFIVDVAAKEQADAGLLSARSALAQAKANLAKAQADRGVEGEDNAHLRGAQAALKEAQLNLEFTHVTASVDGFVTNLELRLGSQVVSNTPALALVDSASFYIEAYFRETQVSDMQSGQEAVVTLMSNPDTPFAGVVDSLGWGIAKQDGSTGSDLLPNVSPTFEWIRLAQRIPVRIELRDVPESIALRVGATASVLVRTGVATGELTPAPALLQ
jgi:multidrug resistance efflux pump